MPRDSLVRRRGGHWRGWRGKRVEYKKPLPSAKCVVRPDQEQESQAWEGTQARMNEQYWPATVQQCLVFIGIARGSFGQCLAAGIFIGLAAIRVSRRVIVANSQPRQDGTPCKNAAVAAYPKWVRRRARDVAVAGNKIAGLDARPRFSNRVRTRLRRRLSCHSYHKDR